ncbi:MAG: [protein-PII] uridylyltransferase [Acidobacteria bacterium]|nr:[protein-PII] uridylyltransferase [Acidobacteriota bacterium]
MQIELDQLLNHAKEKFAGSDSITEHKKQVDIFKKLLKVETQRLRIRHQFGLGGAEITSARSYLVDLLVCRACQWAATLVNASPEEPDRCAVVALGGYGRRELAPFSDVDILFLHETKQSKGFKTIAERVLYLLWDAGLTIGHSFRSVSECVVMARQDLHSRNAMSESRFVTGSKDAFRRLADELDRKIYDNKRDVPPFLKATRLEIEKRYAKFGSTVCLQEPNIKESSGGLRDLHAVVWVARSLFGCRKLEDLRTYGRVSDREYRIARRAYDYLARVRNDVHFSSGRKTDLLTLELQPLVALHLGYTPKRHFLASELFMRDYYQRANELHQFSKGFLERAFEAEAKTRRFNRPAKARGPAGGFQVKQGKLYPGEGSLEMKSFPSALMEAFSTAQREGVELSESLSQLIRSRLFLVNRNFRSSPEAGKTFWEILRHSGQVAAVLRQMHEVGFLGKFLPEFGRITFLAQHDHYHHYTIDEHTLRALDSLDRIVHGNDAKVARFRKVLAEVPDPAPLYLGLLLHDCGKGHGRDHVSKGASVAKRVCGQLNLDAHRTSQVLFLVRNHLLMIRLSQRRNLSEESLIEDFVATVGTLEQLNMLLLLSYADASSVGPNAWNPWKGELLWELYSSARSCLTGSKPAKWDPHRTALLKQQIVRQMLREFLPREVEHRFAIRKTDWWADIFADFLPLDVERHLAMLPERYLRTVAPHQIAQQLQLIKRLESKPLAAECQALADGHCSQLTICTRDSAGLFARLAGTLTAHGINILSADLNTRDDGVVIDTFKVCQVGSHHPVPPEHWLLVEQNLNEAVQGRYDMATAVEKWRARMAGWPKRRCCRHLIQPAVHFDSEVSATSTVIEVRAEDEPGLAYRIARTLASLGLNISFAKIATEKNHALDVFYVTDAAGRKLIPSDMSSIERALLEALGAGCADFRLPVETENAVSLH